MFNQRRTKILQGQQRVFELAILILIILFVIDNKTEEKEDDN